MTDQRAPIVGVMGGGRVRQEVEAMAEALGRGIAERGWVLLNGGRAAGVMEASARGARQAGGLTVGVLPGRDPGAGTSKHVQVALYTGMGDGRNVVNVLSSRVVVALPGGAGTLSEVALALKSGRPVVLLGWEETALLETVGGELLHQAGDVEQALDVVAGLLSG